MPEVFICDDVRTAIGRYGGGATAVMEPRIMRMGLVTICNGVGQGIFLVVERV